MSIVRQVLSDAEQWLQHSEENIARLREQRDGG